MAAEEMKRQDSNPFDPCSPVLAEQVKLDWFIHCRTVIYLDDTKGSHLHVKDLNK
jgi:hypothetical protein